MKSDNGQAIIVYGASTSVGFFTTQLAKRAGYFVVGVSGSSAEYAKSAGADVIVDYRGRTPQELVCSILLLFQIIASCSLDNTLTKERMHIGRCSDIRCRRTSSFRCLRCCDFTGYSAPSWAGLGKNITQWKRESDICFEC